MLYQYPGWRRRSRVGSRVDSGCEYGNISPWSRGCDSLSVTLNRGHRPRAATRFISSLITIPGAVRGGRKSLNRVRVGRSFLGNGKHL